MKNRLLAAALITVLAGSIGVGGVFAQNAPPANPNADTPAVANTHSNNPGAPAAGANSFTEAQARSRIEAAGYSNVSGLTKDRDGIWRGKASKDGTTVGVALDYQGNVVPK